MPTTYVNLPGFSGAREAIRGAVLNEFLKEEPGTGSGELASHYEYVAESLNGSPIIILKRPAWLNNGMDFTVRVAGYQFRAKGAFRDAPKHDDMVEDLAEKKSIDPKAYTDLAEIIKSVYLCEAEDLNRLAAFNFGAGLTAVQAVLALKWLFIEQDVTYWNWSGRHMLFRRLVELGLCPA